MSDDVSPPARPRAFAELDQALVVARREDVRLTAILHAAPNTANGARWLANRKYLANMEERKSSYESE